MGWTQEADKHRFRRTESKSKPASDVLKNSLIGCPGSAVVAHWLLTNAARVRSPWSAVVVYEMVWLVAHSDTWVFSGCSGFLPQKWPPSAKHPCIIQDPIGNKLSSFHGLSWVNIRIYRLHVCFLFCLFRGLDPGVKM
jgi:hypothetical protein